MNEDIKEILKQLEQAYTNSACLEPEKAKRYYDAINNLIHNWNELKKWLEEGKKISAEHDNSIGYNFTSMVLDKMAELEEGGNNEW